MLRKYWTLKSFVDGIFELSAHLVVAKLVKKKDAKLVNLPREKRNWSQGREILPGKKPGPESYR